MNNNVRKVTSENYPTDAGREGELIFRLVYHKAGCRKPFERLWISSMEDAELKAEFPDRLERLIEEMSRYLAANGRTYQNYAAALRIWAENDKKDAPKQGVPDYTCKEGESL